MAEHKFLNFNVISSIMFNPDYQRMMQELRERIRKRIDQYIDELSRLERGLYGVFGRLVPIKEPEPLPPLHTVIDIEINEVFKKYNLSEAQQQRIRLFMQGYASAIYEVRTTPEVLRTFTNKNLLEGIAKHLAPVVKDFLKENTPWFRKTFRELLGLEHEKEEKRKTKESQKSEPNG